jgi:O-antigen ligase
MQASDSMRVRSRAGIHKGLTGMPSFGFIAFAIWFLILPFTVISSIYLDIIAVDKLMAPALIMLWIFLAITGKSTLDMKKIGFTLLAFVFFFVRNLSKLDTTALYTTRLWGDAILFGYFCLPILYIDSLPKIRAAAKLISINATVGCVSALLVAIGLLTLPYERFSAARFGLEIQKSIGVFSSYGDLAQFSAYFLLLAVFIPASLRIGNRQGEGKLLAVLASVVILMGLIGNQSRSMLLSLLVATLMAVMFHYRSKTGVNKFLFNSLFVVIGTSAMAIAAVVITRIIWFLENLGGAGAAGTAQARLEQYGFAFQIINQFPILGADSAYYLQFGEVIDGIHNMWLSQLALGGMAGALLLFWLLLRLFRASLKLLDRPETRQYGVVTIGYLFAVLVSTLFYPGDTALFWALLGMNTAIVTTARSSIPTR